MNNIDVVIIGSGPAGVSAAFPLVNAGLQVVMLDVGNKAEEKVLSPESTLNNIRKSSYRGNDLFLGRDLSGLRSRKISSPKFKSPTNQFVFSGYDDYYKLDTNNFAVAGSLAAGGLSNAWGAAVSRFDDNDLGDYPISYSDLQPSYDRIAKRIGISGTNDDQMSCFHGIEASLLPAIRLNDNINRLYSRYSKKSHRGSTNSFILGHSRNAVITENSNGRSGCIYCGLCVWGCAQKAIYSALYDLEDLISYNNFSYLSGRLISEIRKKSAGYTVIGSQRDNGQKFTMDVNQLILASGTIGSTKLIMETLNQYDNPVNLYSNPVIGFAMFLPEKIGNAIDENTYAMSQLSFKMEDQDSNEGYAFGNVFPSDTLLPSEYIRHVPLPYPLSRKIIRLMQPSMLVGNCFLSGSYGQHKIQVGKAGRIGIVGKYHANISGSVSRIKRSLTRSLMSSGVCMLPGGFKLTSPGEDLHYAGSIPMKKNPKPGESSINGEVHGLPGLYVVDGAVLTTLPAKPHTYTIMANADRISTTLAAKLVRKN